MLKKILNYFTLTEWVIWLTGIAAITVGFALGSERNLLSYLSSLAGITCVIFNAKGNVAGQAFGIIFAVLYGIYAYQVRYFGEMLIYFCLMMPIHIVSIVTWLKNKFNGRSHEVAINSLKPLEYALTGVGALAATAAFYFILRALGTDNLIVSTISLTASITAAYLMLRRCEFFSICFICNDIILIVLWSMKMAAIGIQVLPSVLSFALYLINDSYCFFNWRRLKKRQRAELKALQECAAQNGE